MRIWLRWIALGVVCVAALVASFSTLASLAAFTGWPAWTPWLLPLSLDALGMTACLVWLDATAPKQARWHAKWMTWIAAGLSVIGNGAGHLASTGHIPQGLILVVLVGAVPPAALAVTVHLIVLASPVKPARPVRDAAPVPAPAKTAAPKPSPKPKAESKSDPAPVKSGPESGPVVDEVLLQRGRHIWDEYMAEHHKPIPRDELKKKLGAGSDPSSKVLAVLKKEKGVA